MTAQPVLFGSKYEENVYRVLVQRKIEFRYQVLALGGYGDRGSTIIDFVLDDPRFPQPIALYVDGAYFHNGKNGKSVEDLLKRNRLEQMGYKVMAIGEEAETIEGATAWLKQNIL